jgi:hypothetical protein
VKTFLSAIAIIAFVVFGGDLAEYVGGPGFREYTGILLAIGIGYPFGYEAGRRRGPR